MKRSFAGCYMAARALLNLTMLQVEQPPEPPALMLPAGPRRVYAWQRRP